MFNHSDVSVGGISIYESEWMARVRRLCLRRPWEGEQRQVMVVECHEQTERRRPGRSSMRVTGQSDSSASRPQQRRSLHPGTNVPCLKHFYQGILSNGSLETGSRPCGRGDFLLHLERLNFNLQAAGGGRRWREIKEARVDTEDEGVTFPRAGNHPSQTTWLPAGVKQLMLPSFDYFRQPAAPTGQQILSAAETLRRRRRRWKFKLGSRC